MAYVVPIHRPGSVRHALKLEFLEPGRQCLVIAKANRIEIHQPTAEGLILLHTRALYGKVTMLNSLRPASASTDHLFVGTDRQLYFTLAWDAAAKQLRTATAFVDQADTTARDSQSYDRCAFDPARRFLTLELFEGILTVIPVGHEGGGKGKQRGGGAAGGEVGALAEPIPVRVPELFIRSWTYLHPRGPTDGPRAKKPRLALLFDDSRGRVRLHVKELDYAPGYSGEPGQAEFEDLEPVQKPVDPSASHVVPVAAPVYGLLVLAETAVTYVDEESTLSIRDPLPDATIFATWAVVDDTRWLLADDYGRLYFLMLLLSDDYEVQGFKVDFLGRTSRASVITYLDSGYVFVGSHLGDSQVVKIGQGSIEVIQTISNISPVLDFTIMDMGNRTDESQVNEYSSGQARIVTGSGAFQDGSLRSVRSGVGIEELGSLGNMPGITELFSLKSVPDDERADTLIASFLEETRVFHFSAEGEVEEMQRFSGFTTSQSTVLAQNCPGGRALQCTSSGISLVDLESGMQTASWSPDTGAPIVAASANDSQVVLSVSGTELVSLDVTLDLRLIKRLKLETDRQISCIHLPSSTLDICVVGFWQEATVAILKSGSLEQVQSVVASEDSAVVPRSVLIAQVLAEHAPTLFVALSDGNVVTFELDQKSLSLTGRQSTILGTQQANLKALPRGDGLTNVFATCEHPSLIYGSEGRIVYSAVTVENASYVCPFDSEAYPGAIAIATNEDLKLALIDHERTTHVQKLAVGETVRRIAYSSRLKAFGMGTIRKELKGGAEIVKSHFKLADEVVFKELDTYDLKEDELVESVIRADVSDGLQGTAERFLVGTSYISEDEPESYKGRILILEVTEDRTLKLVSELNVRGACRALAVLDRKIVAALVKTVVVYNFENGRLEKDATFRTSTLPIDISVTGNLIAVADVMKSVSIVRYQADAVAPRRKLEETARHFQIAWSTAVAPVTDETWLLADAEGNLAVLHRNVDGVSADDRRRLETTSEFRLGELVNRIRPVHVPASPSAVVLPRAFMATTDGSIYLFGLIKSEDRWQERLMNLQEALAACVQSPGHVPFAKYRAFKNSVRESSGPFRFIDGELIEKFLECPPDVQREIVEGLDMDVEDVKTAVESLRRIH